MKKFNIIVADPAWSFSDKLKMSDTPRGAEANYPLLDLEEIKKLRVEEMANPNGCILALWVPSSMLQDGLDVMKAWGFQMRQTYVWVKSKKKENITRDIKKELLKLIKKVQNKALKLDGKPIRYKDFDFVLDETLLAFGMGRLFRQSHEICLLGINTTEIYKSLKNKSQRSVSFAENLRHSTKPEHLQDSLEIMFPEASSCELFARRQKEGWICIGNEAPMSLGEDIRDSIKKIIDLQNESPPT